MNMKNTVVTMALAFGLGVLGTAALAAPQGPDPSIDEAQRPAPALDGATSERGVMRKPICWQLPYPPFCVPLPF